MELASRMAETYGLTVQAGEMVAEVRTPGPDKGMAIKAFMAEAPFARARPIFVGDDLTDEAGFAAVSELGGAGVLVGRPRSTHAIARLDGPHEVLEWLSLSLDAGAFSVEITR
jgi:trehalose 6-phosphate phosphatase